MDGYDGLKVAGRLGVAQLPRQVCYLPGEKYHVLSGNAGLPQHTGQVTTRGLQEWVCLLPQELHFDSSALAVSPRLITTSATPALQIVGQILTKV